MEEFNTIYQLRKSISAKSQAWIISALRQDEIVWRALNDPTFLEKAIKASKGSDEFWTPCNLGFLSLDIVEHLQPKAFPFLGLPIPLQKQTMDLLEKIKKGDQEISDLRSATLLAIWLNSESRNKSWFKAIESLSLKNSEDLEIIKSSLSLGYGFSENPSQLINELLGTNARKSNWNLVCDILLTQPLHFEEQLRMFHGILKNSSLEIQNHVTMRLNTLGFRTLSHEIAQALIKQQTEEYSALIQKIQNTEIIDDPHRISEIREVADLYSIAGETDKASQILSAINESIEGLKQKLNHKKEIFNYDQQEGSDKAENPVPGISPSLVGLAYLSVKGLTREESETKSQQLVETYLHEVATNENNEVDEINRKLILKALKNLDHQNLEIAFDSLFTKTLQKYARDTEIIKVGIDATTRTGQWQKAIEVTNLYLMSDPENTCVKKKLADALEKIGKYEMAFEEWKGVLQQTTSPTLEDLKKTAELAFQLEKFIETETLCSDILTQKTNDDMALTIRGISRIHLNRGAQGENDLIQAVEINPDNETAWNGLIELYAGQSNFQLKNMVISKAIKHLPDSAILNYQKAKDLLENSSYTEALPLIRKACRQERAPIAAIIAYAETLEKLGLYDEEKQLFEKVENRKLMDKNLIHLRARTYLRERHYSEAIPLLSNMMEEPEVENDVYLEIAEAVLNDIDSIFSEPTDTQKELNAKILSGLEKIVEYAECPFLNQLLFARMQLETGKFVAAFKSLKELTSRSEARSQKVEAVLQASLGQAALKSGANEVALAALKEADLLLPSDMRTMKYLALAYSNNQLNDDALEMASQIRSSFPDQLSVVQWYAKFMKEIGRTDKALSGYEKLYKKDPLNFTSPFCKLLIEEGHSEKAKEIITEVSGNINFDLKTGKEFIGIATELNNLPLSLLIIEQCERKFPEAHALILEKICVFLKMEHHENAIQEADKAVEIMPDSSGLFMVHGTLRQLVHDDYGALDDFLASQQIMEKKEPQTDEVKSVNDNLVEMFPGYVFSEVQLASKISMLYAQKGQIFEAFIQIQKALHLNPDNLALRHLAIQFADGLLLDQDVDQLSAIVTRTRSDDVENTLTPSDAQALAGIYGILANRSMDENDAKRAKENSTKCLTLDPSNMKGLIAKVRCEICEGNWQSGRNELASLSTLNPEINEFCLALVESKQWQSALNLSRRNTLAKPLEPKTWLTLAKTIIRIAETDEIRCGFKAYSVIEHIGENKAGLENELNQVFSKIKTLSYSDQINRWEMRGRMIFALTNEDLTKFAWIASSPEEFVVLASSYCKLGLQEEFEKVVIQYPMFPALLLQQAIVLSKTNPAEAEEVLNQIILLDHEDDLPFALLAKLKMKENDSVNAIHYLEKAAAIKDDEPEWHKRIAALANIQKDNALEIVHLKKALELTPTDTGMINRLGEAYLKSGMPQNVFDIWNITSTDHSDAAKKFLQFAQAYRLQGNMHECRNVLKSAVALDSGNGEIYYQAGKILFEGENPTLAFEYSRLASVRNPSNTKALVLLSKVTKIRQNSKEALAILEKVPEGCNSDPELLLEKARLVQEISGEEKAREIYQSILNMDPKNTQALAELSMIEYKQGETPQAKVHALRSLEGNPSQDKLLELVGKIMESQGQFDGAVQYYIHAIHENSQTLEYYLTLCQLYQKRREYQQAVIICQKATIAIPQAIEPYVIASQILKDGKDYLGAEQMIRKAQEIDPDNLVIRRQLGAIIALNMVMSSQEVNTAL
jgi:tetratricopeptide (TPR) repeat protein